MNDGAILRGVECGTLILGRVVGLKEGCILGVKEGSTEGLYDGM